MADCRLVLLPGEDRGSHTLAGRETKVLLGPREVDRVVNGGCRRGVATDAVLVSLGGNVGRETHGLVLPGGVDLECCGVCVLGTLA